jgi:CRP/FNR family transcriptional regulator, cyclic AMP receptor protein
MRGIRGPSLTDAKESYRGGSPAVQFSDALNYLPRKPLLEYPKGHVIYSGSSNALYLSISGRVKVALVAADGAESVVRIVPPEGLFGEVCLAEHPGTERAVALDPVQIMAWKPAEIVQQVEKEPALGLALMEVVIARCLELSERLQAMATCMTPQRVMLALLHLARQLGEQRPDGAVRMASLTHHTLAEYVGTSREIVSSQMSNLRRRGLIQYSRQYIDVYCEAVEETLRNQGVISRQTGTRAAASSPIL